MLVSGIRLSHLGVRVHCVNVSPVRGLTSKFLFVSTHGSVKKSSPTSTTAPALASAKTPSHPHNEARPVHTNTETRKTNKLALPMAAARRLPARVPGVGRSAVRTIREHAGRKRVFQDDAPSSPSSRNFIVC